MANAELNTENSVPGRPPDAAEEALLETMRPITEAAIERSVCRDASILGGSLHPIIGPAIRQAISHAFLRMIQSVNTAVENSLSAKSIKWRAEAWRTGKSFAEIVAVRTLLFRVEQSFLIEKKGGILLHHASQNPSAAENADLISSMLSAVKEFVQDSFKTETGSGLGTITVGDTNLWIENGPQAVLALIVRGNPPESLRERMADAMTTLERAHLGPLDRFDGDTAPFESCAPILEGLLLQEKREEEAKKKISIWPYLLGLLVLIGLLAFRTIEGNLLHNRELEYLAWLRIQPGVVVGSVQHEGKQLLIEALYDPLRPVSPEQAFRFELDPANITIRWKPYVSLDPVVALLRSKEKALALSSEFEKLVGATDTHPVRLAAAFQNASAAASDAKLKIDVRVDNTFPTGSAIFSRLAQAGIPMTVVSSTDETPPNGLPIISVNLLPSQYGLSQPTHNQ